MCSKEQKFLILRKQLDNLGYRHTLAVDSVYLVESLLCDLLKTTESLRRYKELSERFAKEQHVLENGIEPYKHDNAKLVQQCNDLHLKLLQREEEANKLHESLQKEIRKLESTNSDLQFISSQHVSRIKSLELESAEKARKLLDLQSKGLRTAVSVQGKKNPYPAHRPTLEIDAPLRPRKPWKEKYWSAIAQEQDSEVINMCELAEERICILSREVSQLKDERMKHLDLLSTTKCQLENQEKEIERLRALLRGGRTLEAIGGDCLCKDMQKKVSKLADELKSLESSNKNLENQLRDSLSKQHEAMTRAVRLADRNKQLEHELHDIDRIAIAVEAECNSTVQENSKRVMRIQERLKSSLEQIHNLEREVLDLKSFNQEAQADIQTARKDCMKACNKLERCQQDKRKLTERINQLTMIEHDLNVEIERLSQSNSQLKRQMVERENKIEKRNKSPTNTESGGRNISSKTGDQVLRMPAEREVLSPVYRRVEKVDNTCRKDDIIEKLQMEREYFIKENKNMKEQLSNIRDGENDPDIMEKLEKLEEERDFFLKESQKLREQLNNMPSDTENNNSLRSQLNIRERELMEMEHVNKELSREKQSLLIRIESLMKKSSTDKSLSPTESCATLKCTIKRLEREYDMTRADIRRLEEERDALRERLKIATETQVTEHARLEKAIMDSEDRVRRLEAERRELLSGQGSRNAAINTLEDQTDAMKEQLKSTQSELFQQRALYNQIRSQLEQSDRSLSEIQGQLIQSQTELSSAQERIRDLERDRATLDRELASLKTERTKLRGSLVQVDQEKDSLLLSVDSKTERVAKLEQELKAKESKILNLESSLAETQTKLEIALEEATHRDSTVRTTECEVQNLRKDLEAAERTRDCLSRENRRMQDDLASSTNECRLANAELENCREEAEILKRQLQEYVCEIKRIEDALGKKETERCEMLEQFKGLSMEASLLENNNHSLETEAHEQKCRLKQAEDRICDLEHQLEIRESLVQSYENQIAELSGNIACLETRLHKVEEQRLQLECDLNTCRDLCNRLDCQKDNVSIRLADSESEKARVEVELARLQQVEECLENQLAKDKATINALENEVASMRHETVEQRISTQDYQSETIRLRKKLAELQSRLEVETTELRRYQCQAAEYNEQCMELQRQLTNEKFERARLLDENRRHHSVYHPTCSTCITCAIPRSRTRSPHCSLSMRSRSFSPQSCSRSVSPEFCPHSCSPPLDSPYISPCYDKNKNDHYRGRNVGGKTSPIYTGPSPKFHHSTSLKSAKTNTLSPKGKYRYY